MKKLVSFVAVAAAALTLGGCAYGPAGTGPAGTYPAFIYSDNVVYPAANTSSTVYNLDTDDFDIRGTVVATGEMTNILGIIAQGDNGYQALLAEARSQGADDVINVRVDVKHSNILSFYVVDTITLTGQAITFK